MNKDKRGYVPIIIEDIFLNTMKSDYTFVNNGRIGALWGATLNTEHVTDFDILILINQLISSLVFEFCKETLFASRLLDAIKHRKRLRVRSGVYCKSNWVL